MTAHNFAQHVSGEAGTVLHSASVPVIIDSGASTRHSGFRWYLRGDKAMPTRKERRRALLKQLFEEIKIEGDARGAVHIEHTISFVLGNYIAAYENFPTFKCKLEESDHEFSERILCAIEDFAYALEEAIALAAELNERVCSSLSKRYNPTNGWQE